MRQITLLISTVHFAEANGLFNVDDNSSQTTKITLHKQTLMNRCQNQLFTTPWREFSASSNWNTRHEKHKHRHNLKLGKGERERLRILEMKYNEISKNLSANTTKRTWKYEIEWQITDRDTRAAEREIEMQRAAEWAIEMQRIVEWEIEMWVGHGEGIQTSLERRGAGRKGDGVTEGRGVWLCEWTRVSDSLWF